MTASIVPFGGSVDRRFAPVADAFRDNFHSHAELGAAVCVWHDGQVVVDLWGGWSDPERRHAWHGETLVNVFSVGKGLVATLAAHLVGVGLLDLDWPVARVWPQFGHAGKEGVTVRQVLAHQAGLPAIRRPLPDAAVFEWVTMTGALAAEEPWWRPGSAHGYHANTFGFLVGEIARRADPEDRSVAQLARERLAAPLGADFHIGVPPACTGRVAAFDWPSDAVRIDEGSVPDQRRMEFNAYWNPPTLSGGTLVNTDRWRHAEIPSANAHASARGVARLYAALAAGGELDGCRVVDARALDEATSEHAFGHDLVLGRPSRFAAGFQLTQPERPLGPGPRSFGHFGAGGGLGFADPDNRIGFGYVMNTLGDRWQNPRNRALINAVYTSIDAAN